MELDLGVGRETYDGYFYTCFLREQRHSTTGIHRVGCMEPQKSDSVQGSYVSFEPNP